MNTISKDTKGVGTIKGRGRGHGHSLSSGGNDGYVFHSNDWLNSGMERENNWPPWRRLTIEKKSTNATPCLSCVFFFGAFQVAWQVIRTLSYTCRLPRGILELPLLLQRRWVLERLLSCSFLFGLVLKRPLVARSKSNSVAEVEGGSVAGEWIGAGETSDWLTCGCVCVLTGP